MTVSVAPDRDALYYPNIHITDVNWLKSTLLCFPNVRRMVPNNFTPDDTDEIREFCELTGPRNTPLLTSVDLFAPRAQSEEVVLLQKLQANDTFIRSRYSKQKTEEQYGPYSPFRLHDEKIILDVYAYLVSGGNDALAWRTDAPPDRPSRHGGQWLALHPALGKAILSVKAIAIANDFGLDIVTDAPDVHQVVISQTTEDIFDELVGKSKHSAYPGTDGNLDDLVEIVMTTSFDVRKLSAKQIAALLADGQDLRRFKNELLPIAASIPPIRDAKEREERLKAASEEVIAKWKKYRKSLPRFAFDALIDASDVKWPEIANSMIAGAGSAATIGVGAGIGVFLVSYAGVKVWRKYKKASSGPYAYLNRIAKAQKVQQSFLSQPLNDLLTPP